MLKSLNNNYIKVSLGIIGTVFIGAIGSGIWDVFLKPILGSTYYLLLNIISLGLETWKDNTYSQIAKGFHEEPSICLFYMFSSLFFTAVLLLDIYAISLAKKTKREITKTSENFSACHTSLPQYDTLLEAANNDISTRYKEIQKSFDHLAYRARVYAYMLYTFSIILVFSFSLIFSDALRLIYVNTAITHFNQVYVIVSPHISNEERLKIMSSFAQIKNKSDYVEIINDISNIAQFNGIRVPEFEPW